MVETPRSKAEQRFASLEKRVQTAMAEQEQLAEARRKNTARLRELRLAKEADEAADKAAAAPARKKPASKGKTTKVKARA